MFLSEGCLKSAITLFFNLSNDVHCFLFQVGTAFLDIIMNREREMKPLICAIDTFTPSLRDVAVVFVCCFCLLSWDDASQKIHIFISMHCR